jgi:hypothetical protein
MSIVLASVPMSSLALRKVTDHKIPLADATTARFVHEDMVHVCSGPRSMTSPTPDELKMPSLPSLGHQSISPSAHWSSGPILGQREASKKESNHRHQRSNYNL